MITDKDLIGKPQAPTLRLVSPTQEPTFRITRTTPVINIKTPLQKKLALAYLNRWASSKEK